MVLFRSLLLTALLLLIPNGIAHAAPAKDWSRTVALTPKGSFLIGNPAAKTKLVEYVSYTCPHCAHFVNEGSAPLKSGWVSKGLVSVEVRNLVRDRYDVTAALLARCGGAVRFPGNHDAIFAAYLDWMSKAEEYERTPSALPGDAKPAQIMAEIADKTGLIALMAKRNVTPAQNRACLADQKAMDTVLAMTNAAINDDHVTGTPGFLINGTLTEAHDWNSLRALLPAPGN